MPRTGPSQSSVKGLLTDCLLQGSLGLVAQSVARCNCDFALTLYRACACFTTWLWVDRYHCAQFDREVELIAAVMPKVILDSNYLKHDVHRTPTSTTGINTNIIYEDNASAVKSFSNPKQDTCGQFFVCMTQIIKAGPPIPLHLYLTRLLCVHVTCYVGGWVQNRRIRRCSILPQINYWLAIYLLQHRLLYLVFSR